MRYRAGGPLSAFSFQLSALRFQLSAFSSQVSAFSSHPSSVSPHASTKSCLVSGRKSAWLLVAKGAPTRIAIAAMQQSAKLLLRRPVRLKRLAANSASERSNISATGSSCRARDSAAFEMGPQRNSPQATALIPSVSPAWSQATSRASSMLPGRSASIRKFVSRWITELDTLPSGFRDGLLPCSGTSLGQAHCLLQLAENFQQILRSLRHGQRRILHSTLHCFLRRHTPSLTQATERSCCHLIKVNSQCRLSVSVTSGASSGK